MQNEKNEWEITNPSENVLLPSRKSLHQKTQEEEAYESRRRKQVNRAKASLSSASLSKMFYIFTRHLKYFKYIKSFYF
jgi:hypothetical protein